MDWSTLPLKGTVYVLPSQEKYHDHEENNGQECHCHVILLSCFLIFLQWYIFNDPENRKVECPSATGYGTADALAKVYGIIANGGKTNEGKVLLSEKAIKLIEENGTPVLIDEILGFPSGLRVGFQQQQYKVNNNCTQVLIDDVLEGNINAQLQIQALILYEAGKGPRNGNYFMLNIAFEISPAAAFR